MSSENPLLPQILCEVLLFVHLLSTEIEYNKITNEKIKNKICFFEDAVLLELAFIIITFLFFLIS